MLRRLGRCSVFSVCSSEVEFALRGVVCEGVFPEHGRCCLVLGVLAGYLVCVHQVSVAGCGAMLIASVGITPPGASRRV